MFCLCYIVLLLCDYVLCYTYVYDHVSYYSGDLLCFVWLFGVCAGMGFSGILEIGLNNGVVEYGKLRWNGVLGLLMVLGLCV